MRKKFSKTRSGIRLHESYSKIITKKTKKRKKERKEEKGRK